MANSPSQDTVIAQGVRLEGDFSSQGDVIIEGEVSGSIKTTKDLKIGETAVIQADVGASNAIVSGVVQGNIIIENQLNLTETSRISGDVSVKTLSVAAGAVINGRLSMEEMIEAETSKVEAKKESKKEEVGEEE